MKRKCFSIEWPVTSMWQHIFPHNCFNSCLREQSIICLTLYGLEEQSLFVGFILCSFVETHPTPLSVSNSLPLSQTHTQKDTKTSSGRRSQDTDGQCIYWLTAAHWSAQLSLFKRFPLNPITSFKLLQSMCQKGTLDKPFPYLMEFSRGGMKAMQGASRHR